MCVCKKLKDVPTTTAAVDTFTDSNVQEWTLLRFQTVSISYNVFDVRCKVTRPDVLMLLTFLVTRCQNPGHGDWRKALWILYYLYATRTERLVYRLDFELVPRIFADANHHLLQMDPLLWDIVVPK